MTYTVTTVHYGTIQFLYGENARLFSDRRDEMEAKFTAKLEEVTKAPGIWNDTQFCTQAEGYRIMGGNKQQVEAAIKKLYDAQFIRNTEDGWKLQTAQEKNWETEKKSLDPKPRDRNEIVRNALRLIFG